MIGASSPLRVTFIGKQAAAGLSGIGRYAGTLCAALGQEGVEVTQAASPRVPLSNLLRKSGYDIGEFLASYPPWIPLSRPADVYHLASQNLATLLTWRRLRRPVVVTVHDIIPYVLRNDRKLSNYRHVIDRVFDRWALLGIGKADAIIADSEATKRDLVDHLDIAAGRIFVVPLGVDSERFRPTPVPADFRKRYHLDDEYRYILYVGSEAPHKNVTALVEAFSVVKERFPDVRLIKVGAPQSSHQRQRLLATARRLGVGESVAFFDSVTDEDLPLFYNAASLFVSPSLYEGFGLPVLEAMACGTPVICFHAASLPEIVGDAGLMVAAGDRRALAEGIIALLDDDELRQRLAQEGVRRARTFTWQRTAQQTSAVYRGLTDTEIEDAAVGAANRS